MSYFYMNGQLYFGTPPAQQPSAQQPMIPGQNTNAFGNQGPVAYGNQVPAQFVAPVPYNGSGSGSGSGIQHQRYAQPQPQSRPCPRPRPPPQPKPHPEEIKQSISAVHTFWANRMATTCHVCRKKLITRSFDVVAWIKRWTSVAGRNRDKATLICAAECMSCGGDGVLTCLGCGKKPNKDAPVRSVQSYYMQWCCRLGRMFIIWVMLARYDLMEIDMQHSGAAADGKGNNNAARMAGTLDSRGVGYAAERSGNFSPFINLYYSGPPPAVLERAIEFKSEDAKMDGVTEMMAGIVTELIPTWNNRDLPPELHAMLQLTMLIDRATDLLRNDSIEEVSKRAGVYSSVLCFVQRIGEHPELRDLVQGQRYCKLSTAGLQAICDGLEKDWEKALILGEKIPSLAERLEQLAKQSEIIQRYTATKCIKSTPEGKVMMKLCNEITAIYKAIGGSTGAGVAQQGATMKKTGLFAEEKWVKFHKERCLLRNDAVLRHENSVFASAAAKLTLCSPGRMKKLVTDIAGMSTSLPQGIFVQVGESRPDVMRCLIMGHPDTPYAYGLFDFDIFCDENYPKRPPLVHCRTAVNHAGLSPNLHDDGKVCLSLLGTWKEGDQAAQWQPDKSTILSVLISLQAMVLSEDPYRQEPAHSGEVGPQADAQARKYILDSRPLNVKYAMIDWLREPGKRNGIWMNVVRAHFRINKTQILQKVNGWAREDSRISKWRSSQQSTRAFTFQQRVWNLPGELRRELDKLG
ncbi:hypothetical protein BDBG_03567 [Blastomyces gilchristii SLH14081]|uniref:UBC core domain-containing protein n=1 Tax=Blastomyces gilchristii (strain SLH14081) TaxID=559298 RepID=A0A179UIE0_BLAGS|nr:uncharacterized protein BDBG_03567 [Blastomyces gilchristii SLH14081]OAT07513.1 hypothetical protein BDBG_03567 [Blastomyces gilchristii SLH14081]